MRAIKFCQRANIRIMDKPEGKEKEKGREVILKNNSRELLQPGERTRCTSS